MYDEAGRLVESVRDPEWTPEDYAVVVAHYHARARFDKHGHDLHRSMNPAMLGEYDMEFLGECYACAAEAEWNKGEGKNVSTAELWVLKDVGPKDLPPMPENAPVPSRDEAISE